MADTRKAGPRRNWLESPAFPLAWFEKGDYPTLQGVMGDLTVMPVSFERWRKDAETRERKYTRTGQLTARVMIDLTGFQAWCIANNTMQPSGDALRSYTRYKLDKALNDVT